MEPDSSQCERPCVARTAGSDAVQVAPTFDSVIQYFFLPQSDGKVCLLKHVRITSDKMKVKGAYIKTLLQGQGYELQKGGANKKLARKSFQWLLEQLGGSQTRRYSFSPEVKVVKSKAPKPDEAAWNFLMEHGELDKVFVLDLWCQCLAVCHVHHHSTGKKLQYFLIANSLKHTCL